MAGQPIKVFQFIQNFQKSIGIVASQSNQKQYAINLKSVIFQLCALELTLTTGAFVFFEAKSMFQYGFAAFVLVTTVSSSLFYLSFSFKLKNTLEFIENCEEFIKKRVNSTAAYRKLIGKIELFNEYFWYIMCITLVICTVSSLPYTLVRFFIYDMEEKSFYLSFPCWYPFNWRTLTGYPFAFFALCIGSAPVGIVYAQFLNIFFGSCWLFMFIAEDIAKDVKAFNAAAQSTDGNYAELTKRFCDLVQIYSDAKQCVDEFSNIFEYSLLSFFAWVMLALASTLVAVQFELWGDADLFNIVVLSYIAFAIISCLLILCEPCARMIKQFEAFEYELSGCNWYLFPIELQRMYIIFLSEAQNGIKITSYGGISCERDSAKKILNKAFSYFMTFRNFRG